MRLQTVVETPAYLGAAKGVLTEAERIAVVNMVAENPLAGIPLGGGVRKARFGKSGRGKSGGRTHRVLVLDGGDSGIPTYGLFQERKGESQPRGAGGTDQGRETDGS